MVQAVCRTPLAPLADGLGGHAIALGEDAGSLLGAGDLGAGDGRGAGVRMDLQHRSDLPLAGLDQTVEQVAVGENSMPHRVPTMFRDLTPSTTVAVFPLDAHLPSRLRRKMDERCLIGNDVGSVGLVAAGGQGTDASVVHAGACCRVGACVPRWPAGAGAA